MFTGHEFLDDYTLVTTEDGTIEALLPGNDAGDDVEKLDGLLVPGFVNCHCHLELSHMKGKIAEGTGLVDFVFKVITERHTEKEVMLEAINSAEQEMVEKGIVAVGDICNNPITLLQKMRKNLYYHNFIEASGFVPEVVAERFKRSVDLYSVFGELYADPQASNSIVPHAPYSAGEMLFNRIAVFPGNRLLTMHNQETAEENLLYKYKRGDFLRLYEKMNISTTSFEPTGKSALQSVLPHFFPQQTLILVHNVATSRDDIQYTRSNTTPALYFCLCPNANLYISGQLPPVDMFMQEQCNIVLGTDSLASNHQLCILSEMNTLKKNFPAISYDQMLPWATINGAKALGIDNQFGSFEKGKQPGLVLIDKDFTKATRLLHKEGYVSPLAGG